MTLKVIQDRLNTLADKKKAADQMRFFKTGPGEYGEGDIFMGIKVPELRKLSKAHSDLSLQDVKKLLISKLHEERHLALFIMVLKFKRGDAELKRRLYDLYLAHTRHINNWDLVDASAEHIIGGFLMDKDRSVLYRLAASSMLWERRISIMATFHFLKQGDFKDTLKLAAILLKDRADLIQKAVGWMLREIGKRDLAQEEFFLKVHYQKMPRTMLRYAIEKFPEPRRQAYLKGNVSAD